MALRRHTRAFAAAERLSFPPSKSSLHFKTTKVQAAFSCAAA